MTLSSRDSEIDLFAEGNAPENKSQRVYRMLREAIISGDYSPGFRLVLSRLAEEYDVSTVPVREAVRQLEAQGLVSHERNVGFTVTGVNAKDYADAMETLAFLEGAATRLAVPFIDSNDLAEAQDLNEQMRAMRDRPNPGRFTDLNGRFHMLLCRPCPNRHLFDLVQREWGNLSRIRRSTFTYVPDRARTSVEEHDDLIRMIARGEEPAVIEQAFREHTLRTMNLFLERRKAAEH